ncbi:Ig-like domain-containing protein, partial [Shewanella baltica]|uniref:Ig-like domain-containing protein n=1 Tax=Shewanella baltica TaxID=62322 RepID=UPI00217CD893
MTLAAGNKQSFEAVGYYSDGSSRAITDLSVSDWHVSDQEVGYFNDPEVLIGGDTPGILTVYASKGGITSNTVNVEVTTAVITAIEVTPSPVNVAKGQTQLLVATATYSDTTSSDVSSSVTWTPVDTNTATVTSAGVLSGVEVGSTTVTASKDGVTSNAVAVTVSDAVIETIEVTPSPVNVAKGQTQPLVATATYSDTTSSDVSSSVTWTPVDTNTATVTSAGVLSGVEVGSTTVTASKDGVTSNAVAVTVSDAVIETIEVTPSPVNVAKGQTQPLVATATYSDTTSSDVSSSVTWTPVDTTYATVTSAGVLSGVEVGSTTVTASKDGITSNVVTVNVTDAVITAIEVTPSPVNVAKGQTQPLVATATYSDTTSSDVSSSVTWTPVDTTYATVTSAGVLSGVEVGSTTVTASKDGITSNVVTVNVTDAVITAIEVTPSPVSVAKGQTQPLVATATYSDTTSSDVSSSVTWTPVDTTYGTVTSAGVLSGVEVGSTTVTASKDGVTSNAVAVTVSDAVIETIEVTPSPVNVAKGQTQPLVATATYSDTTSSDVSSSVTWTPVDTTYATVTSAGLLSGVAVGGTTLTASEGGKTSNTVTVTVTDAVIDSIQVTPSLVNIAKGQTQQLTAEATYSDGTSSDISSSVTWTPADPATATVTPAGLLSGVAEGSTTLTASEGGKTSN